MQTSAIHRATALDVPTIASRLKRDITVVLLIKLTIVLLAAFFVFGPACSWALMLAGPLAMTAF